ncbi:hypothetical protein CEUSTIGMA_g8865.t1 [Chlamydomonas eustigma]|uniref:Uncharacterized protein n=1 Tax=Chlamydomonas eustigma TaxID=1157962 RepID=A0A250XEC8_9CHLO|nr:hypothetical protein CEUSTIGMA_g8865.t1 [Chlamydomonas eustigma]|eukprot:GAX81435.1 hypothetical protein CEUSTIGMA_g8865.t1 [Chlamydomonas eustigma]
MAQNSFDEGNGNSSSTNFQLALAGFGDSSISLSHSDLNAVATVMAQVMGFGPKGIRGHSLAALGMQKESQEHGYVPSMQEGGVTASFQSIGATGRVKPEAAEALSAALIRNANYMQSSSGMRLK